MNNFSALDSRNRRNLLAHSMNAFSPPFHKNYSTDTSDMKTSFGDSLFINTVHLIPEPIKMNLADSVVTLNEKKLKTNMAAETKVNNNFNMKKPQNTKNDYYPSLAGITNFFSGVFNVMGAIFHKRSNSPVQYYDCFEQGFEDHHQMTPSSLAWQSAKHEDQNINGRAQTDEFANETYTDFSSDMSNKDFRSITAHCEDKLNRVRLLLNTPPVQKTARPRRPKRAFHEAGSVEELFEDAFNPEDFIALANETFLEYCSPFNHHHEDLHMVDAPKVKINTMPVKESMEIIQNISPTEDSELKPKTPVDKIENSVDNNSRTHVILSCEDKVNKLKALLQSRRAQKTNLNETKSSTLTSSVDPPVSSPISIPKPSENHNQAEVIFPEQVELPVTPESPCPCALDPSSYFDEVTGRFHSSSATDSEDSFQIVFSDSPKDTRKRLPSDCESEDSFIVFEESPDSCYTSNDVFGDDTNDATNLSDSEDSDSDCGSDLDSGLSTITLSHSLTRTFGDLTDGSLYEEGKSEDVVDCAFRSGVEIPGELVDADKVKEVENQDHSGATKRGLLLDDARKRERKKLPAKKVQFSPLPPKVHVMRVWAFAARQARAGHWERHALDRERFKRRIADVEVAISWVLKPQHRSRVMFQRFMPWWNAQRRKEQAEKKQRELEERLKREKEEAEKLALANNKVTSGENDSSDTNETTEQQKQVATKLGEKEKSGVSENTQENAEVRVESSGNKIINNVNCNINRLINSGSVVKSDNTAGESAMMVENSVTNKTSVCDETETRSDNGAVAIGPRDDKQCNGVSVHCKIDTVNDDCKTGHSQIVNEESIADQLPLSNTDSDRVHIVKDKNVTNGGVTIESKMTKGANAPRERAS